MKKHVLNIAPIIFLTIFSTAISAQSLSFINFSTDNGLPQNSVYVMMQDKEGFLWLGTEGGLSKFDGTDFKNFDENNGLIDKDITAIYQDNQNQIWVGTTTTIARLDGENFVNYSSTGQVISDIGEVPETDRGITYSILEDSHNRLYFANRINGVLIMDTTGFRKMNVPGLNPGTLVRNMEIDRDDNFWILTSGQGIFFKNEEGTVNYTRKDGLPSDSIISVMQLNSGALMFGTTQGIVRFENSRFRVPPNIPASLKDQVTDIIEDKEGTIWFCSASSGIVSFDGYEYKTYMSEDRENSLQSDRVYCAIEDQRGDLWFGMQDGGLSRLAVEKFAVYSTRSGLVNDNTFAIFMDRTNSLWFGTFDAGLTRIRKNKVQYFNTSNGFIADGIPAMTEDAYDNLWFATLAGMAKYSNDKFTYYGTEEGMFDGWVLSLLEDSKKQLWVGGQGGIRTFDKVNDVFVRDPVFDEIFAVKPDMWIQNIYEDFDGLIWFSTDNNGIYKFNGRKLINYNVNNGLPSNYVYQIMQDRNQTFWISTDKGLAQMIGDSIRTFTTNDGLVNNNCYFAMEEGDFLYIGTTKGISRFEYGVYAEKGEDAFKTYTVDDGLVFSEMNMFAFHKDYRKNLYFGTSKGVIVYNPENVPRVLPSDAFVQNINIADDEADFDTVASDIELDYTEDNITINYRAIVFTSKEKIRYKLRLDPLDARWTETSNDQISYRSLPAGDYTFRVLCLNADGVWSENEANLHFVIYPPFWETWWFRAIIILSFVVSVYLFYQAKTRQVRRRNIELANMVRERTKDLEVQKNKSDELLQNILPGSLINELKSHGSVIPRKFNSVSILFTDFKGFTQTSSMLPADRLVDELNEIFFNFDQMMGEFELEKMKTIGDAYMAAGGLPTETDDHAIRVVLAAMKMQEYIKKRSEHAAIKWQMRVGVHTGTVVAGVVGTRKFTYDIWGDTVNIASRMESSGEPARVNISAFTYMLIKDYFDCEYRGKIDAKGKGQMDMYFVNSVNDNINEVYNYQSAATV